MWDAGAYPVVSLDGTMQETVSGDIIDLRPSTYARCLRRLDLLEGYVVGGRDNLYDRVAVTVSMPRGQRTCWVYIAAHGEPPASSSTSSLPSPLWSPLGSPLWARPSLTRISTGDWLHREDDATQQPLTRPDQK